MKAATALLWLATVLYPLAIYFGIGRVEPRWLALLLLLVVVARAATTRERYWLVFAALASTLVLITLLSNQGLPLKLYPVLINAGLLAVFATSLRFPPSAVERIARLREPELPAEAVAYTRRVTQVWCVFFVFNGAAAAVTALWASDAVWALYNGLIAYVLMGLLFGIEWLVRPRRVSHG
jgi:uncharacterized membrane protein